MNKDQELKPSRIYGRLPGYHHFPEETYRDTMGSASQLLLIEVVLPTTVDHADPEVEKLMMADLNMLAVTEGRERSETEWAALLSSARFELRRIVSVPGMTASIIEAVPCE